MLLSCEPRPEIRFTKLFGRAKEEARNINNYNRDFRLYGILQPLRESTVEKDYTYIGFYAGHIRDDCHFSRQKAFWGVLFS